MGGSFCWCLFPRLTPGSAGFFRARVEDSISETIFHRQKRMLNRFVFTEIRLGDGQPQVLTCGFVRDAKPRAFLGLFHPICTRQLGFHLGTMVGSVHQGHRASADQNSNQRPQDEKDNAFAQQNSQFSSTRFVCVLAIQGPLAVKIEGWVRFSTAPVA